MVKKILICSLVVVILLGCGRRKHYTVTNDINEENPIEKESSEPAIVDEEPIEIDNKVKVSEVRLALPLNRISITSPFGTREDPITGKKKEHLGLDLDAYNDYPVSMMKGIVLSTGFNNVSGNFVTLKHGELTISYCHLSKILVKTNQQVEAGTVIGIT